MREPSFLALHWIPPQEMRPTAGIAEIAIKSHGSSVNKVGHDRGLIVVGASCNCIEEVDELVFGIIQDLLSLRDEAKKRFDAR
jgi:hypothetical protein